ncbi:hypothetical protein N4G58_08865 [Edwardsiella piscicida]|nr:hypothetical protein N4G58_08865 [Edwardsiella piscicida]
MEQRQSLIGVGARSRTDAGSIRGARIFMPRRRRGIEKAAHRAQDVIWLFSVQPVAAAADHVGAGAGKLAGDRLSIVIENIG